MTDHFDVLIVGGGQGGAHAALTLRQQGFAGSIGLLGAEPHLPYDRPPLSKEYLAGEKSFERMVFRSADFWAERGIELRLGERVVAVDADAHRIETRDGSRPSYGQLIWSAGGIARRLDCLSHDLPGIHGVRSRADVDGILAELPDVNDVAVVGGGYIGLESAAVLSKLGRQVTLIEAQGRVLSRVAAEPLSRFYEAEHRVQRVDVRLGAQIERIVERNGRVAGVQLADREIIPAQMVIVGIGIDAEVAPLRAAGATCGNGVRVDKQCRTSLPDIFAIGDCAEHRNSFAGGDWIRIESVQNATDQAAIVAKTICGGEDTYRALPWFWSNQYDLKLQTVGLHSGSDQVLVRGDPATRSFSVIYLRAGAVVALDCVNAVKDYVQGRGLILARTRVDTAKIIDPAVPLKSLA